MQPESHLGASRIPTWAADNSRLVRCVLLTVIVGIWSLALFLFVRRWWGAMARPLEALPILSVATMCVLVGALVRSVAAEFLVKGPSATRFAWWTMLVPGLAVFLLLGALSLPGTAVLPLGLMWTFVVAGELVSAWSIWKRRSVWPSNRRANESAQPPEPAPIGLTAASTSLADRRLDESVSQNCLRLTEAEGAEVIQGWMRGEFQPGQRLVHLHAAFCPSLSGQPEVVVQLQGDDEAKVTVGEAFPYGARFDVRRRGNTTQSLPFVIEFKGTCPANLSEGG
jgi:hypothetical protein